MTECTKQPLTNGGLTPFQIAECSRFSIGQFVEISESYEFADDWKNTVCQVIGVRWDDRNGHPDYSLLHNGDQVTTGFLPNDLTPSTHSRPGASDLVEAALQRAERAISQYRDTMTPAQIAGMIFVSPAVQDLAIRDGLSTRSGFANWALVESWRRDLDEMHLAPSSSEGIHAHNWADKPHRVLYDAIRIARRAIEALVMRDAPAGLQNDPGLDGAGANAAGIEWAYAASQIAGVPVTRDDVSAIIGCYVSGATGEQPDPSGSLHPDTAQMLWRFLAALWRKLLGAQQKRNLSNDWKTDDWEAECRADLRNHVKKGDPLDVAAYAAFCWARGWRTHISDEVPFEVIAALPGALKAIEDRAAAVQPNIVLGDDDSIHLTPRQEGYREGLQTAAEDIRATLLTANYRIAA